MEYRTLGGTGLKISTHCLGTMMFGAWGNSDIDDCVATINAAIDAGINFVDTADVYSDGVRSVTGVACGPWGAACRLALSAL